MKFHNSAQRLFACLLVPFVSIGYADETWNAASEDVSQWSLVKYTNKNPGIIGGFTNSNEGMIFSRGSGMNNDGLTGNESGFLKYTLAGNADLSLYDHGSISITYQDTKNSPYLPPVLFLDGLDAQGNKMLLACELATQITGSQTVASIELSASNFSIVTSYYYSIEDMDDPNASYDMTYRTSSSFLSDAEFTAFLATTQSLLIRNYNDKSDWYNPMVGSGDSVPYTYLFSLDISSANIPEPITATLLLPGMVALASRRRKEF